MQLILITCVAIQQFWKKAGKISLKVVFFWTQFAQKRKGVIMGHTQDGKNLSFPVYVYVKKVSFPAKTTVTSELVVKK